jgi:hypothetical protein
MTSESELAWALADAVSVCFTGRDRLGIYTALGAGETYTAIETMLDITVCKRYPLPARLISALAVWLGCYVGNEHEPAMRRLLSRVEPQALRTTGPPLSRGVWSGRPIRPSRSASLIAPAPPTLHPNDHDERSVTKRRRAVGAKTIVENPYADWSFTDELTLGPEGDR